MMITINVLLSFLFFFSSMAVAVEDELGIASFDPHATTPRVHTAKSQKLIGVFFLFLLLLLVLDVDDDDGATALRFVGRMLMMMMTIARYDKKQMESSSRPRGSGKSDHHHHWTGLIKKKKKKKRTRRSVRDWETPSSTGPKQELFLFFSFSSFRPLLVSLKGRQKWGGNSRRRHGSNQVHLNEQTLLRRGNRRFKSDAAPMTSY